MTHRPDVNSRTIRITKPCEFGDPGDRLRPEPFDVAALLVETRGVAVYEDEAAEAEPSTPATPASNQGADRRGRRRRGPANP